MIIKKKHFFASWKAIQNGIVNKPSKKDEVRILNNLLHTMECGNSLLDNVFIQTGKAKEEDFTITSMFRCPALNKLLGGSTDHPEGKAFDFLIKGWTLYDICKEIAKSPYEDYKQLVLSKYNVHLSFDMDKISFLHKSKFVVYENGKYVGKDINKYFKLITNCN